MKKIEIEKRRDQILSLLKKYRELRVSQLVTKLGVSDETIRTDLKVLANKNLIVKHFGTASLNNAVASDLNDEVEQRLRKSSDVKGQLAQIAVNLLKRRQNLVVSLDEGTTIACIASLLDGMKDNQIFTNSLLSLMNLRHSRANNIYCLGGKFNQDDMAFQYDGVGLNNESLHYDYCFIGSSGVKGRDGICSTSFADTQMKRQMIKQSDISIAVVDAKKFQRSSLVAVTPWQNINYLVTNLAPESDIFQQINKQTKVITTMQEAQNEVK